MQKMSKSLLAVLVVCGLAVGFAAVGQTQLRISFSWPTYADPAVGSDYSSSSTFVNVYDSLVYPTLEGGVRAHVAELWEVSDDGLAWTYYLRKGIEFHDGTELTAQDVKFSMDRLTTIGEGYGYLFASVESTEVVNDYEVRFILSETVGPFETNIVRLYILNEDLVMANLEDGEYGEFGDYGKKFLLTNDAGSGAYTIKEFPLESYVLMEKYPDYWGRNYVGMIEDDSPDLVQFFGITEPITVRTMLANRELEITDQWQPEESLATLDALEGVDIARIVNGGVFYYMMHTKKAPTDDIHFRKAMAYAFDHETAAELQHSWPSHGPIAKNLGGWKEDVFVYTRDLDKAREELALSKYADQLDEYPVEVHWITEVPWEEKTALLFQANMAEIGIKVNVVRTGWLSVVDEMADIEASPNIATVFVAPHYPEAGSLLHSRYHSDSAATWEQNEWLQDAYFDEALEDAIATTDTAERFAKYGELQDYIVELCPSLFVFDHNAPQAYQTYVDWPAAKGDVYVVMGYNMDARLMKILPH